MEHSNKLLRSLANTRHMKISLLDFLRINVDRPLLTWFFQCWEFLARSFSSLVSDTARVRNRIVYLNSKECFKRELDDIQVQVHAIDPTKIGLDVIHGRANWLCNLLRLWLILLFLWQLPAVGVVYISVVCTHDCNFRLTLSLLLFYY